MKKLNQNGYIDIAVVVIVICAVYIVGLLAYGLWHQHKFDQWAYDCYQANGMIHQVANDRVECFMDGEQVTLPGWEGW